MNRKVIFTDLDGTLLDEKYSFKKAIPALSLIREKKIPLIICTSKTRAEIELYRKRLKNKHPFISENGGAIFIPKGYFSNKKSIKQKIKVKRNYEIIELGVPYKRLLLVLKKIKKQIPLRGFSDMSIKEISKKSGLTLREARLAKKREYDEAFKLENKKDKNNIIKLIKKINLNYTLGGRYMHILGNNDKGKAVKILINLYKEKLGGVESIGLGDSENDIPMLGVTNKKYMIKGPAQWNKKVIQFLGLDKREIKRGEELYETSITILKKLQLGNGAILASFPKTRYPYIYPRDHSICTLALIEIGENERTKKALSFILKTQKRDGSFPQRINKKGKDRSYKPIQLDNTALVLYAFANYVKQTNDKDFFKKYKKKIKKSMSYIRSQYHKRNLFFSPNSVHEFPPLEEGLEVWVNATCYSTLKELEDIGINTGMSLKTIKNSIEKNFWNGKHFIKTIRLDESSSVVTDIDSSAYALADFGVFKDDNEKIKKTVAWIEKELWHRKLGGICRYKKHVGRNNGGWGPWPHFTLMICRHFIRLKEKKKADKYLEWILKIAYQNKLPEHISTKKDFEDWVRNYKHAGILRKDRETMIKNIRKHERFKSGLAYSVLPLAWPHAEFIRTYNLYKRVFKIK